MTATSSSSAQNPTAASNSGAAATVNPAADHHTSSNANPDHSHNSLSLTNNHELVHPPPPMVSASNQPAANNDRLPDFKDQVHNATPPPPAQASGKHQKEEGVVAAKVGHCPPPAPVDGGPAFKDQCANVQKVPTNRGSPDLASPEAEEAGQPTQTTSEPLPVTAQVVDNQEIEEQIRRRIGEAQAVPPSQVQPLLQGNALTCKKAMLFVVAAQVVTPSQVQPLLRGNALTCKKVMLYVVAILVLVVIVLGVALPLTLGEEGPTPSTGGVNEPSVVPTNSPSTGAPTDIVTPVETKLTASDGAADGNFGRSVAIAGDTIVVGAYRDDNNGPWSGSAYVFTLAGITWTEQAKLTASDSAAFDEFGWSVSIADDTIVVGAPYDDDSGSAYIFTRTGTTWTEQAKLTASDVAAGDQFGESAAISGDTIVVGSNLDDDNGINSGSAYIFTRTGTTWTEQAKLTASDGSAGDEFGISVAIMGDTIVVGAFSDDDNGSGSGSVHVFARTETAWTQQAKLTASDGAANDGFGTSVAIAGDTIVVGALGDDVNGIANSGSAYVFVRTGITWTQQGQLTASDGAVGDLFGGSVTISGDTIVVGAVLDDVNAVDSGSAYVFTRTGFTWTQQAQLAASDGGFGHVYGISVAIANDTIVVGARDAEGGRAPESLRVPKGDPEPEGTPGSGERLVACRFAIYYMYVSACGHSVTCQ